MEHSPSSEADSDSAGQEIFRLSQNPKVLYRVHKSPPQVQISKFYPVSQRGCREVDGENCMIKRFLT
jgi:hypothetical protein